MTTPGVAVTSEFRAQLRTFAMLLPLGVTELDDAIAREAADNPWLEVVDRPLDGLTGGEARIAAAGPSLGEHLRLQLEALGLDGRSRRVACYVVGLLDGHAYLREDDAEVARLARATGAEARRAVEHVQALEPAGVAARSLGERFRLQLARAGETRSLAVDLTFELEALAAEGPPAFAARRSLGSAEFARALRRLRACDPQPAREFGNAPEFVHPEVRFARDGDRMTVSIDRRFWPQVRLASLEATRGLSAPMRRAKARARLVVDALARRHSTLERIAMALLEHQSAFFQSDGDAGSLIPLSGRELARAVGCAESTISRALAGRYASTPFGTVPLRAFLARRPGSTGMTVSAVHEHIRALAAASPDLSDDAIARALRLRGVRLARRTVAKYRGQLGLRSSRARAR